MGQGWGSPVLTHSLATREPLAQIEAGQLLSTQCSGLHGNDTDDSSCNGTKAGEPGGCSVRAECLKVLRLIRADRSPRSTREQRRASRVVGLAPRRLVAPVRLCSRSVLGNLTEAASGKCFLNSRHALNPTSSLSLRRASAFLASSHNILKVEENRKSLLPSVCQDNVPSSLRRGERPWLIWKRSFFRVSVDTVGKNLGIM